jgi:hypothetical protein
MNNAMESKIKLYHGTIHEFDAVDVAMDKPFKDFGAGFYLSPSRKHSANLALRNKQIEIIRAGHRKKATGVNAWIYVYEFDLACLRGLKVKKFVLADREWTRFVVSNRNNKGRRHDYDVVIGPTANDNTRASIQAFFAGVYGNINSDSAIDTLVKMLEPYKLPVQYFFGSQSAADLLILKDRIEVIAKPSGFSGNAG